LVLTVRNIVVKNIFAFLPMYYPHVATFAIAGVELGYLVTY